MDVLIITTSNLMGFYYRFLLSRTTSANVSFLKLVQSFLLP